MINEKIYFCDLEKAQSSHYLIISLSHHLGSFGFDSMDVDL